MPKGGGCSIFVPREEGSSCPIASARRPPRSRLDAALKASRRNKVERERGRRQVERGCRGAKRRKAPARAPSRETRSLPVPAAPGQPSQRGAARVRWVVGKANRGLDRVVDATSMALAGSPQRLAEGGNAAPGAASAKPACASRAAFRSPANGAASG